MAYSTEELQKLVADYFNRYDESLGYELHLMREGKTTQATEHNEIQSNIMQRMKNAFDAIFRDGDVIQDAQIVVDAETGAVTCAAGKIYLKGAVRAVPAATLTIPTTGTVNIGIKLRESIISELEDPSLRFPGAGNRGEGDPGAWRLRVEAIWAYGTDGVTGDFYPVYAVDDGIVRSKETPPNLDAVNQALRRYDLDSTGTGTYAVSGLSVIAGDDLSDGRQVYHVSEGRAHVNGAGIDIPTSRRVVYAAQPDLRLIDTEVHAATAESATTGQRITLAHPPLHDVTALRITAQKTVSVVHGAYSGAADALPDTSVVSIVSVKQGETTYTATSDYIKTGDTVDWSPAGQEPLAGSTYEVMYTYITSAEPGSPDFDGFTVTGAVEGSSILVSYRQALPRYDCLALTADGTFAWFQGVAAEQNQLAPTVPDSMLRLATVFQTWRDDRTTQSDSIRVVAFDEIQAINTRIDWLVSQAARQQLESDMSAREGGISVGMFTDPLIDDTMRDPGVAQTAAVVNGVLTLPVTSLQVRAMSDDVRQATARGYTLSPVLEQKFRTMEMKVNPYMAFDPLPARVTLTPAVDRWTDVQTEWASAITQRFNRSTGTGGGSGWAVLHHTETTTTTQFVSKTSKEAEHLRQIDVAFSIEGFGPGEELSSVTFDGVAVTPTA